MRKSLFFRAFITILMFLLLAGSLPVSQAQEKLPPPPPPPPEQKPKERQKRPVLEDDGDDTGKIIIDTNLVVVDVSVIDKTNRFIKGLAENKFQIFEDQIAQKIEFFSQEQVPISYGIVIDTSGSMRRRLTTVIKAAKELIAF